MMRDAIPAKSPVVSSQIPPMVTVMLAHRGAPRRFVGDSPPRREARQKAPPEPALPVLDLSGDHGLTDDQLRIVRALRERTVQVDELIEETQIPTRRVLDGAVDGFKVVLNVHAQGALGQIPQVAHAGLTQIPTRRVLSALTILELDKIVSGDSGRCSG